MTAASLGDSVGFRLRGEGDILGTRQSGLPAFRLAETIEDFFDREVRPHVPDAWIDTTRRDPKDGKVGIIGYEINFNRYFYRYQPPRKLEDIEAERNPVGGGRIPG